MSDGAVQVEAAEPDPARAWMYGGALAAGVLLILVGDVTPLEASGFVSPFLVIYEQRR
ncbi:hypothetical protein [Streptomyces erythrochromogenes]|uniref:hypothetical protein n=1 Tax=Streptomyces erythrochromogenes TaxID=285574 RepID=UPI0036CDB4E3